MSSTVRAAEVTLIAPGGIRAAVDQMIPAFEKATGHKVKATFGSGGGTKERVIKGEPFDVPIVQLPLEPVVASGHVMAASETPLALVAVGVAVRTGTPKPDISSADAVKRLLLGSKAIAYPNAAAARQASVPARPQSSARRRDETEDQDRAAEARWRCSPKAVFISLAFISDHHRTRVKVGPLPRDISTPTVLMGYVSAHTRSRRRSSAAALFVLSRSCSGL